MVVGVRAPTVFATATIHVPADVATIQAAIDAAVNGDTIVVASGIYHEKINFHGKAITVTSESGPSVTAIDGDNTGTVVTFQTSETSLAVLNGFTVQHGSASFGAGITLTGASPTITGNIFDSNSQGAGGFGAAIGGNGSSPTVKRNWFQNNTCDTQFLSGVIGFVNSSSPKIIDNVFIDNPCRAINMTLPAGNSPQVTNNTIVGNQVGIRVDTRVSTTTQLYRNNLIVGNGVGFITEFGTPANGPTWKNNLVFNNTTNYSGVADQTGVNGNISADPLFLDAAGDDFHLDLGSPAIDAGDGGAPSLPIDDFDGISRVLDGDGNGSAVVDIGAFEFGPNPGIFEFSSAAFAAVENGGTADVTIIRKHGKTGPATVDFATGGGTATVGVDYISTAVTLSFADNDVGPKTVSIPLLDGALLEGNETIDVALSNPMGGAGLGGIGSAVVTLTDNEDLAGTWVGTATSSARPSFNIKLSLDSAGHVLKGSTTGHIVIVGGQISFDSSTRALTGELFVSKKDASSCSLENGSHVDGQGALVGHLLCTNGEEIVFVLNKQTVIIAAPNGGELWPVGSTQIIRWNSGLSGKAIVQISRDGGISWVFLFQKGTNGSRKWVVEGPTTTRARIRICTVVVPVTCSTSDQDFSIQ
jgi:serine protease